MRPYVRVLVERIGSLVETEVLLEPALGALKTLMYKVRMSRFTTLAKTLLSCHQTAMLINIPPSVKPGNFWSTIRNFRILQYRNTKQNS